VRNLKQEAQCLDNKQQQNVAMWYT